MGQADSGMCRLLVNGKRTYTSGNACLRYRIALVSQEHEQADPRCHHRT